MQRGVMSAYLRPTRGIHRAILIALLTVGVVGVDAAYDTETADARRRPAQKKRTSNFQANKTFGLGIMLGAPTGLSGKYYLSSDTALDFGVGTIYGYRHRRGLHIHVDHLWHPVSLVSADAFELPLYLGIGGRFLHGNRCYRYDRGYCEYYYRDYTAVGVRGPIGLAFDFNDAPIDIFFELAFVLDFVADRDSRYDDAIYFDVNGAVGFRYYFN
jgi:hypothetical protein